MASAPNHPNFPNNARNPFDAHLVELAHLGLPNERSRQDWIDCHQAEIDSLENLVRQLMQANIEGMAHREGRQPRLDRLQHETRHIFEVLLNQQPPTEGFH